MRACEFIIKEEINESPGFNVPGPSGLNFPRGYNLQALGGMYLTRPSYRKYFNRYNDEIPAIEHITAINDRIKGGMPLENAIHARAKEVGMDPEELLLIYQK